MGQLSHSHITLLQGQKSFLEFFWGVRGGGGVDTFFFHQSFDIRIVFEFMSCKVSFEEKHFFI